MKFYHFQQIESTNDFAKELIKNESELVVTADYQSNGKGRSQRMWHGDYGQNVYFSYAINHEVIPNRSNYLIYQIAGSLAAYYTLSEIGGQEIFRLKYPNDVYAKVNEGLFRKICGVLVEHTFSGEVCKSTVIGIGLNVNQKVFSNEILEIATSLSLIGYNVEVKSVIDKLTEILKLQLEKNDEQIIDDWLKKLNLSGKKVLIVGEDGYWNVLGINNDGRLVLENRESGITKKIDDGNSVRYIID